MNLTNPTRWLIPALALLLLTSCGDEQIIAVGGGPAPDAQVTNVDGVSQNPNPAGSKRELVLLHDSSKPLALVVTDQVLIRAKVIDYELGGPASDVPVSYKVVAQTADGDGSLAASQAISGASGEVAVWFKAGLTPTVTYSVELTAENASPVTIEVQVSDTPIGDLAVNLSYEGPIAVKNVNVRLFHGSYTCGQFNPINVPDEVLGEKTLLGLGTNEEILFADLPDGEKYTIVDMAVWGWARLIPRVLSEEAKSDFPHLQRLVDQVTARPASQRAIAFSQEHAFKMTMDAEAHRNMFPGNPPLND